jgi:predicted dehydrogenase
MLDRRDFLKTMAAVSATTSLGSTAQAAPSDRLRLGLIGAGGRGRNVMNGFLRFPDVEVPVICDVIEPQMAETQKAYTEKNPDRAKPEQVVDYRRVLDRKDVDAVIIATTEHWHGLPAIHAAQAGKHVFIEKPLGHTVAEGRAMVDAVKKHGVTAMLGTQQRGGSHYQKAIEIVQSGRLGKVAQVKCWNYSALGQRVGKPADSAPPPGHHWDQWLGPAKNAPFNPARLRHTWWFDYGGGMMTVWGVHHVDIILAAMKAEAPKSVVASGGKFAVDDLADTPDTIEATWTFPNFLMTYMFRGTNGFPMVESMPWRHGIVFHGSEGTMVLHRRGFGIWSDPTGAPDGEFKGTKVEEMPAVAGEQDKVWQRAFVDAVKEKKAPPATLEAGHRATACCQLGNVAYHTGRRIHWDGVKEQIVGDDEASRLLTRPRRKGYELPKA